MAIETLECGVCGEEFGIGTEGIVEAERHFIEEHPDRNSHYKLIEEHSNTGTEQ